MAAGKVGGINQINRYFMTKKDFDKIFREKLEAHSEPVDSGVWAAIERDLASGAAGGKLAFVPFVKRAKTAIRAINIRKVGYYTASVAAVLILAFILLIPDNQPYIHSDDNPAISNLANQPNEKTIQSNEYMEDAGYAVKDVKTGYLAEAKESGDVPSGQPNSVDAADIAVSQKNADNIAMEQGNADDTAVEQGNHGNAEGVSVMEKEEQKPDDVKDLLAQNDKTNGASGFYVAEPEFVKKGKDYSVSIFSNVMPRNNVAVSPQYLGTMAASGIIHSNSDMQSMEIISEAKHSLPLNLGLHAQVKVNSYLSVGVGVSYTLLSSKYEGLVNKKHYNIKQNLHYIGIPINAYFTFLNKKDLYLYANIGGAIEKGIRASYRLSSYDGSVRETKATMEGFQYSANAGIGLEYRFTEIVGLYLEPNVVYYFDSDIPASIRTDQPLQIKGELGFRFHIK